MSHLSGESGSIFGVDSKTHIRQSERNGKIVDLFRGLIGVVVNPLDIGEFEEDYSQIMKTLFKKFGTVPT